MANYGNNRYHVIGEVIFDRSIEDFTFHNGTQKVSLASYYQTTYGIEISLKQPLIKAALPKK